MGTNIKKRLAICLTPPAAKTHAGYTALTWVAVKGVVSIGSLGFPHATIEVPELETGITRTLKGARTDRAQIAYEDRAGDAGQTAVATANEGENEVSIQIINPDGSTASFWTGIIHSLTATDADVSSYEGSTFTFVPNYAVVKGASKNPA